MKDILTQLKITSYLLFNNNKQKRGGRFHPLNNMGFLSGMFSAVVKTALTPVAIVKDAVNVVTGEEVDATKSLFESVGEDMSDAAEDLADGEVL